MSSTETALVRHERGSVAFGHRGIEISTLEDAFRMATAFHKSGLAPRSFASPEAIFVALQAGAELGLSPFQSLQILTVISGKVGIGGDGALALVKGSPVCEYVKPVRYDGTPMNDDFAAVVESKRVGDPEPLVTSFSVGDARLAGLWGGRGPWQQYPKRMLYYRALGFNLRDNFPDVLRGIKTAEELSDYPTRGEVQTFPAPVEDPVAHTLSNLVSPKQLVAIRAIANRAGVDATQRSQELFGHNPEELTKAAASQLIDALKSEGADDAPSAVEIKDVTPPPSRVRPSDPPDEGQLDLILAEAIKLGVVANEFAGRDVMTMTSAEAQQLLGSLKAEGVRREREKREALDKELDERAWPAPPPAFGAAHAVEAPSMEPEAVEPAPSEPAADRREEEGRVLAASGHVRPHPTRERVFLVKSGGKETREYKVSRDPKTGKVKCDCADFAHSVKEDPSHRCKHLWATKHFLANPPAVTPISESQAADLRSALSEKGVSESRWCEEHDLKALEDLPKAQLEDAIASLY
jgi:hypothetical protein